MPKFDIKEPNINDGKQLWESVRAIHELDLNSCYSYYLVSHHFSKTSAITLFEGEVCGFVTAYLKPDDPSVLFVWQLGVSEKARGNGLSSKMLNQILSRKVCKNVSVVEATASKSNVASLSVFQKLSKHYDSEFQLIPFLKADQFPEDNHKEEMLIKVGPFKNNQKIKRCI